MLTAIRNWLHEPMGDYLRCFACGRLRKTTFFGDNIAKKRPFCPCGRNGMRRACEPHPNSIRWHERLRIFLGII